MKEEYVVGLSTGLKIKLKTLSQEEIDQFLAYIKEHQTSYWRVSYTAFKELAMPIEGLGSDSLTSFFKEIGVHRWDGILLRVYQNLLKGECILGDGEWVSKIIGNENFTYLPLIKHKLWEQRYELMDRLATAQCALKCALCHPWNTEIVNGYINEWIRFSLGEVEIFHDWAEIGQYLDDITSGREVAFIPPWLAQVLAKASIEKENLAAFADCLTPDVQYEEQPYPEPECMKGNGRRQLVTKNGFTYPVAKRKW